MSIRWTVLSTSILSTKFPRKALRKLHFKILASTTALKRVVRVDIFIILSCGHIQGSTCGHIQGVGNIYHFITIASTQYSWMSWSNCAWQFSFSSRSARIIFISLLTIWSRIALVGGGRGRRGAKNPPSFSARIVEISCPQNFPRVIETPLSPCIYSYSFIQTLFI